MGGKFYITTTLPYVNADPHIGFAWELVQADVIARYHRLSGEEVFFNTGTDEHGLKIYRKALEAGKEPQAYADEYAAKFGNLKEALRLSSDLRFIRTTDSEHVRAAQEFWKLCEKNGDIYKGVYKIRYCVGCELEKSDSELENGRCLIHPNLTLETIEEENYFFRFSRYAAPLLKFYEENPDFVLPSHRFSEIKNFVEAGLNDFSISRLKEKMPWGVSVPGDERHVMYVWFDALINYISTLGWPGNEENFRDFWGTKENPNGIQLAGKDQIRQQAAMWQAMLMSAGLPNSKRIIIHGFITSNGEKMSKSLGNVVDPYEVVRQYGTDAFRYWLLRELNTFEDGDFSWEKFKERYNADLANGLGNFAARILALGERDMGQGMNVGNEQAQLDREIETRIDRAKKTIHEKLEEFKFNESLIHLWEFISFGDEYINKNKPWETGNPEVIFNLVTMLDNIAALLKPFLPTTSEKVAGCIVRRDGVLMVKKGPLLFPRI